MGLFTHKKSTFPWIHLTNEDQLLSYFSEGQTAPVLLFKHSTTCSISAMAINNFEREWTLAPEACTCVYLDLLTYRNLSNQIARITAIEHESPQALLVINGTIKYHASHGRIDADTIMELIAKNK